MSSKKDTSKKGGKAKVSVATPKPDKGEKVVKEKKEKGVITKRAEVRLVSFEVTAVIPTQEFGNIMPKFVVEAEGLGIQAAIDHVMPFVETLYQNYAEPSRSGKTLKFLNKSNVTVTEKNVDPASVALNAPVAPTPRNTVSDADTVVPVGTPLPSATKAPLKQAEMAPVAPTAPGAPKSEPYIKAEKAIASAVSLDALNLIEDKVTESEKLTKDEKQSLFVDVLHKHKELREKTA